MPWPTGAVIPGAPRAALWLAELAIRARGNPDDTTRAGIESLAARTGLSEDTVIAVMEGTRWPTLHTVARILDALHSQHPER